MLDFGASIFSRIIKGIFQPDRLLPAPYIHLWDEHEIEVVFYHVL